MAVKIRLARRGRKDQAIYNIVVADSRAPRDGRFIKKIGTYNPNTHPSSVAIDEEIAFKYLVSGAQPTLTVRNLLSAQGLLLRKHLYMGVQKGAITQEEADKRFDAWKQGKSVPTPSASETEPKAAAQEKPKRASKAAQ